jgi:hypothetical protein
MKQSRKVCDSWGYQCYQAMNRVLGGNDEGLIKTRMEERMLTGTHQQLY